MPRTVKPRKRQAKHYQVIAIRLDQTLNEEGTIGSVTDLIQQLPTMVPTAICRMGVADFIATLDSRFSDDPNWQWRTSAEEREIWMPGSIKLASRVSTVVHYFGWRNRNGTKGVYHLALDPVTFYGKTLDEINGTQTRTDAELLQQLFQWATSLRNWARENDLALSPTNGAMGAQFLRDRRFYPDPRRKVPTITNARARESLPGNYYRLFHTGNSDREYSALYLDQRKAHHYHAEHTRFPDSNTLWAHGDFINLGTVCFDRTWSDFSGLYFLRLSHPASYAHYSPIQATKEGAEAFVWSNEIGYLIDLGFSIEGVIAAWGSKNPDQGINRYAKWAQKELGNRGNPPWLKPILLSTYGVLACKPRERTYVFKQSSKGSSVKIATGRNTLHGLLVQASRGRKLEPNITNVLHRGMIEAGTRIESLAYAQYLSSRGYRVLSIYADAVLVQDDGDKPTPPLFPPWEVKQSLTHLQFLNKQAFISGEMVKLPGIAGSDRRRLSQGSFKTAPQRQFYDNLTGQPVLTGRKI